jgi:hypothetical protein
MQGTFRSEHAAQLHRCAGVCEEAAAAYVARDDARDRELVSALTLAAAALDTARDAVDERSPVVPTALLIAGTLARNAIAAAERRGLDTRLVQCVAELRRAIEACE